MRKLVYLVASSLDGFIADPGGSDPSGPDGFWPIAEDYVAHLVDHFPETLPGDARAALGIKSPGRRFDTVVEGRKSYEIGLAAGVADAYPHLRHVVFSTTLSGAPGTDVSVVSDSPVETVRAMKAENGSDIWLVGGGDLAGSLAGEIDQIVLKLAPLTLGRGIPLLGSAVDFDPQAWALVEHTVLPSGTIFLTYDRLP